ncbi:P63C domain-containing protein [Phaeobacter sp.]|uniref:P63C domain-containing protein n=1 Tax=Phaeobacter sp. TaxID=1902409 RepID=UPI0025E8C29B|nr:P63C domain-containing protein [Phaeobacter sp.]
MIVDDGGRAAGGIARAERLSPDKRSEIASKAAKARWQNKKKPQPDMPLLLPGYSGQITIAALQLPCAVIRWPDATVQRVVSEAGIANAILGGRRASANRQRGRGRDLPVFLSQPQLTPFLDGITEQELFRPIDYVDGSNVIRAYDADFLLATCSVWLKARAEGALQKQQLPRAQRAELVSRSFTDVSVVARIDEVTGYQDDRARAALAEIFHQFLEGAQQQWALTFPLEMYREMYRLLGWKFKPWKTPRPQRLAGWTIDFVFDRLDPLLRAELEQKRPVTPRRRRDQSHRWFNPERGHPRLREHIAGIVALLKAADTWDEFRRKLDRVYPSTVGDNSVSLERYSSGG